MAITILPPKPAHPIRPSKTQASNNSDLSLSSDEELPDDPFTANVRPVKRRKTHANLFTPGQTITRDPQWMRGHGTTVPIASADDDDGPNPPIVSTVAGTFTRTNKLLSVTPLHQRYSPSIGDLVVGRIVSISAAGKRWNVDVAAPLLASLPLSAINLPGGVLRRRTAVDELNVRSFFAEGDLVVAEVQDVRNDGSAGLHTRSLRYGKLRNGLFLAVRSGGSLGREGGVVRSRRQISMKETRAGKIDVILGVNGYVFVCAHTKQEDEDEPMSTQGHARVVKREEEVSMRMYASANDNVDVDLRKEIARVASIVRVLGEKGLRVDEEMVGRGYEAAVEMDEGVMDVDGSQGLTGLEDRLIEAVLG